jgi:hypothetical protein
MSSTEHAPAEPAPASGATRERVVEAPALAGPVTTPSAVLALQRTAGNRAVRRALRDGTLPGAAPRRILARRRVPDPAIIDDLMTNVDSAGTRVDAPDAAAHSAGALRLLTRAFEDLSAADRARVRTATFAGQTQAEFRARPRAEQYRRWAAAMLALAPATPDPRQIRDALSVIDASGQRSQRPGSDAEARATFTRLNAAFNTFAAADKTRIRAITFGGQTQAEFRARPRWEQYTRWAEAMRLLRPVTGRFVDPLLIDVGPRPGTADAANLTRLVANANRVFNLIAGGSRDADIRQVFGAANLTRAKGRYAAARLWMNRLHRRGKIVTDRSGYSDEVSLGGLTGFQEQLSISADTWDNPDADESVVTMIHEAMHAGNADVDDKGYINQPSFKVLPAGVKLTNAAHYEVVPRRILDADFAFAGETFVPAGTGGTPSLTPREEAIRGASEMFREAWSLGLNLHMLFVGLVRRPREWNTFEIRRRLGGVRPGLKWSDTLPFWSKVMKLTIHDRTSISATGSDPSAMPVTHIDVALSEGVVRKLAHAMDAVPQEEADATAFLNAKATAAERAAATTVNAERDLLMKLVLRERVGSITGSVDRDFRMAQRMGTVGSTWRDILDRRVPADFAD